MKKYAGILAVLTMAALLMSCGKTAPAATEAPAAEAATEAVTEAVTEAKEESTAAPETEATTEASTEAETASEAETLAKVELAKPDISAPHPFLLREERSYSDPKTYREVTHVTSYRYYLTEEERDAFPKLAKTFDAYNKEQDQASDENWQQLYAIYTSMYEDGADFEEMGMVLSQEDYAWCLRSDENVVSFLTTGSSYWGGVHGDYYFGGDSFDPVTGKQLLLTDVVKDVDGFVKLIDDDVKEQLGEETYGELFETPTEYFASIDLSEPYAIGWTVDYEGVTVYFNPYAIGWYALGAQKSKITFAEAPSLFDEKYVTDADSYIIPLTGMFPEYADVNGDGREEEINVWSSGESEEGTITTTISVGNRSITVDDWSFGTDAYLIRSGENWLVYLFEFTDNDYRLLRTVDLKTVDYTAEEAMTAGLDLGFAREPYYSYDSTDLSYRSCYPETLFFDPEGFTLSGKMDTLSTVTGIRQYRIGEDGLPEAKDPYYTIRAGIVFVAKKDIPCITVDAEGEKTGDALIPEGTALRFVRSDGENVLDMQAIDNSLVTMGGTEDYPYVYAEDLPEADLSGTICRFEVELGHWPQKAGGEAAEDLFLGVMYAG